MALLLSSERPSAAAVSLNPLRMAVTWVGKLRAAGARRQALNNLLDLPPHRLDDLGINLLAREASLVVSGTRAGRGGTILWPSAAAQV